MKLWNYWRSSSSWRVRIVLAVKGLKYEYAVVNLLTGEQHQSAHRARSPWGSIPVLELDDGTALSQSVAICEYLDERYPSPPLLPQEPAARAHVRTLVELVNSSTQPYQNPACTNWVRDVAKADEKAFAKHFISAGLDGLEKLAAPRAGTHLFGDALTLADCYLVPQLFAARRFEVPLAAYPTLTRVEATLAALPAFIAAAAANQPDAPKT